MAEENSPNDARQLSTMEASSHEEAETETQQIDSMDRDQRENANQKPQQNRETSEEMFQRHSLTFSAALNAHSAIERLRQANDDARALVRNRNGVDISAALEISRQVTAAWAGHAEQHPRPGSTVLSEQLENVTDRLARMAVRPQSSEARRRGILHSEGQRSAGTSLLPQMLNLTIDTHEGIFSERAQKLPTQLSTLEAEDDMVNTEVHPTGSAPVEALRAVVWLGRGGLTNGHVSESLPEVLRSDDGQDSDNANHDSGEIEVTEVAEVISGPDGLARLSASSASSSSGEEVTWPDEAYTVVVPPQADSYGPLADPSWSLAPRSISLAALDRYSSGGSNLVDFEKYSELLTRSYGSDEEVNDNRVGSNESRRTLSYTLTTLESILEESEPESAVLRQSSSSVTSAPTTIEDATPQGLGVLRNEDNSVVSASLSPGTDVVSFETVVWDSHTQPRNSSTKTAISRTEPRSYIAPDETAPEESETATPNPGQGNSASGSGIPKKPKGMKVLSKIKAHFRRPQSK